MAPASTDKVELVALNKADTIDAELAEALAAELRGGIAAAPVFTVSGATGDGVDAILDAIIAELRRSSEAAATRSEADWSPL